MAMDSENWWDFTTDYTIVCLLITIIIIIMYFLLFTGKFPDLSEMDPESKEYWLKVRRMGKLKNNKLMKFKRF